MRVKVKVYWTVTQNLFIFSNSFLLFFFFSLKSTAIFICKNYGMLSIPKIPQLTPNDNIKFVAKEGDEEKKK